MTTVAMETRANAWTLVALLGLATASLVLSRWNLGMAQVPTALGIAALKIMLVAMVFMGMARARASLRLALLIAVVLILSLVGFVGLDEATRQTSRPGAGLQGIHSGERPSPP